MKARFALIACSLAATATASIASTAFHTSPSQEEGATFVPSHLGGTVSRDGDGWAFEGGQPAGSLTFRIRAGNAQGSSTPVTGTMRAQSLDAGWAPTFAPTGVRLEVDAATFQGTVAALPGVLGRLRGTIAFVGADGTRATCSEVSVQMQPGLP